MTQPAISQLFSNINEVLELEDIRFSMKLLQSREWYLQVFSILFPFLGQEWKRIAEQIRNEEAAIDRILLVLVQEGALPEQYLSEIKGSNVVKGDQQTIITFVQILNEFVEQALQEGDEQGEQENQSPQNQEEEVQENEEINLYEQYKAKTQEQPLIRNKSPMVTIKGDSEPDHQRNVNSVLGIGNEFQDHQQEYEEEHSEQKQNINFNKQPKGFNHPPQIESHPEQFQTYNSQNNKFMKMTNYKNSEDEQEDNFDQEYLHHKLNKCKSEDHFKNIPKKQVKNKKKKNVRTLVSHPNIPKNYHKARNNAEKKLTRDVKTTISGSRKVFDKENYNFGSPAAKQQLNRKKRQANYYATVSMQNTRKSNSQNQWQGTAQQNMQKLKKLLKWKQNNLKRQQEQVQQDLEMKVQLKKQKYVKKINKLILNLEKEKIIEDKRLQRQRQKKEKIIGQQRLQAIQQQYRNQMKMLTSKNNVSKKIVGQTDHRQIIQNLQKQLKKQNEKQINSLKTKLRRQQAQLDDDLQVLQREIVKAYKRN